MVDTDTEVDFTEPVICMILECAEISDGNVYCSFDGNEVIFLLFFFSEHVRDEVHDILKDMFAIAENKVQKDI